MILRKVRFPRGAKPDHTPEWVLLDGSIRQQFVHTLPHQFGNGDILLLGAGAQGGVLVRAQINLDGAFAQFPHTSLLPTLIRRKSIHHLGPLHKD